VPQILPASRNRTVPSAMDIRGSIGPAFDDHHVIPGGFSLRKEPPTKPFPRPR
jgi:hypothetical protein